MSVLTDQTPEADYLQPYKFYFELPLYTRVDLSLPPAQLSASKLFDQEHDIHAFNPMLGEPTTYHVSAAKGLLALEHYRTYMPREFSVPFLPEGGLGYAKLECKRTQQIHYCFFMVEESGKLYKVGQYPSIADFHTSKIREYKGVLTKEKQKEFTKAIGLAANGVGVGSFVYLRRIFETLLYEAYEVAKKAGVADTLEGKRTDEKIDLLRDYLPSHLVRNKSLYGILSKGIHELEEQECLLYFDVVKTAIELILDQRLEERRRQLKEEENSKKLQALTKALSKKP